MKHYSLEEAANLLPQVIPVLQALSAAYIDLRALEASVAAQRRTATGDGHILADPWDEGSRDGGNRIESLGRIVRESAGRLDTWGIELKDPEKGLIDFFHRRDGRSVYLCYCLGEQEIGYWHELDAGFAGRQPIDWD